VTQICVPRVDSESEDQLFLSSDEANGQARFWINAAYQLFRAKQDDTTPTLEMVQGIIFLPSVIANSEGVSIRYRSLISTAKLLSRQMSLHRLEQGPGGAAINTVRIETSRCVWWYLITTDW
jgi:hypothetical protein